MTSMGCSDMTRLIDADELIVDLQHRCSNETFYKQVKESLIDCAPTIDAVEVVRCWECTHRRKRECPLYNEKYMEYDMGYGDIEQVCKITDDTIDDGFCYKGERRG